MVRRPRIAKVQLNSATGRVVGATGVAPSPEWVTGVPGGASVAVTEDCEDPVEVDDGGARGWPRMSQSLTFRQNAGTGPGQAPVSLPAGLGGAVGHRTDAGHLLVGAGRRAAGGGGVCRGAAGDGGRDTRASDGSPRQPPVPPHMESARFRRTRYSASGCTPAPKRSWTTASPRSRRFGDRAASAAASASGSS